LKFQTEKEKPAMKRPRTKPRLYEDPEHMQEMRADRPNHTARDWIEEALALNTAHCGDDARAITNMLYLALDSLDAQK
jgi:hypothetical protein